MQREHISNVELAGRLGRDPELLYTGDGTPYAQLSIATSEGSFTDREGVIREKTEWHRAVAFGELAETIAGDFAKGDAVALKGALRINSFEKDGIKNRTSELHVESAARDDGLSRNEVRLVGVVREDPKEKPLDNGRAMTLVSIATRTVANGKDREDWHSVTLWGRAAEAAAREMKVGDTVAINGALRHRIVPDNDGNTRKLSAIECSRFQVLERALDRGDGAPSPSRSRTRGKNLEPGL